ncbi:MAG: CotH kinase family protein [Anaerolineales bacterium]|nr:CotH kinase family protein [Anaerolineales bacterium]
MKSFFRIVTIIAAVLFLIYVSIISLPAGAATIDKDMTIATLLVTPPFGAPVAQQVGTIDELPFRDNAVVYENDNPGSVVTMYLTIRKGNSTDNTDYTWEQVNDFTKYWLTDNQVPVVGKAEVIVQFGDEKGPLPGEVGYSALTPNGTIQIRGATTSLAPQKSYKVELFNNAGTWRGQSTINLNKHIYDETRFRNKLSFDLLKVVPDMISLRTQFIHVYVKDETTDPVQTKFVDYGLFTQVEQPNKRFLESRLLDRDGQFYKVNDFEFYRYPDEIRLVTDPLYDADAFSLRLEIKGNKDHTKLIQLLDDVNNEAIPIEQTFEKYFNSDNYFTWMAFNILVGNLDTQSQNYYLYSPKNGTKWYIIPWDYDDAFPLQNKPDLVSYQISSWENGVSNYWGVILHRRILGVEKYRQLLDEKILELMNILTPQRIENLIHLYQPVVDKYTQVLPDSYYLPSDPAKARKIADAIPDDIETNYDLYTESLKKPMPFYLGSPTVEEGRLSFSWDESYDFNGEDISYHFVIAKDWTLNEIVYDQVLINTTNVQVNFLDPGGYFWGVTATNESGYMQYPFDNYYDIDGQSHPGLKRFYITPEGEVLE